MDQEALQRDLGRLEGSVEALRDDSERRLAIIEEKVDALLSFFSKVRGGWVMLLTIISIASAVSSFVTAIWLKYKGL